MSSEIVKVQIKWKKEKFDVDVNINEKPSVFKAQLYALSGIIPERQKIMMKGMTLKDDNNWKNFVLKQGSTLLLMGSGSEPTVESSQLTTSLDATKSEKKILFEEDINDQVLAQIYDLPAGIVNLGNTCYLNSVIQCFYAIPLLRDKIINYSENTSTNFTLQINQQISLMIALKQLFIQMNSSPTDLIPFIFLPVFHSTFPDFAEKETHDNPATAAPSTHFRQQDANECLVRIRTILTDRIKLQDPSVGLDDKKMISFMDQYFRGDYEITLKLPPDNGGTSNKEEPIMTYEHFYSLRCFINTDVKYLHTGLTLGLKEKIERFSETLGKNTMYEKNSLISRLPAYLIVQFERFFFKKDQAINAKIRKEVKFSLMFDIFEFCTASLKERLRPQRKKFKEADDKKIEDFSNALYEPVTKSVPPEPQLQPQSDENSYSFPDDPGSNNSGFYDLIAVLTHQGRTSNSGHYVAWVKRNGKWIMCDDNNITPVTEEQILKLSGGGDWHTAYVLIYGPRILKSN